MTNYKDSTENAYRRLVRAAIRKSNMTKSDRDITLAIVNLWFHHRNGPKGYIHPGRKHLAKKANVSIITVARCLTRLRDSHVILAIKNPKGEGQKPTHWLDEFMALSAQKCPTTFTENVPPLAGQNVPQYKYTSNVLLFENNLAKKLNGGEHE